MVYFTIVHVVNNVSVLFIAGLAVMLAGAM